MTATITADWDAPSIAIHCAQKSNFTQPRRDDETILAWLERLCDEHNALHYARN